MGTCKGTCDTTSSGRTCYRQVPACLLQQHHDVTFVVDEAAAAELTRFKSPWLTGDIEWTQKMIKKAVVNMALKAKKASLSVNQ